MVPTTVERLREGQGVLERVLRTIKMERVHKRSDGSTEKDSGIKTLKIKNSRDKDTRMTRTVPELLACQMLLFCAGLDSLLCVFRSRSK